METTTVTVKVDGAIIWERTKLANGGIEGSCDFGHIDKIKSVLASSIESMGDASVGLNNTQPVTP